MITSYKDLTLKKYQELREVETEGREEIDIQVELISILNDMDEDVVLSLPLPEYSKMVQGTAFLYKAPEMPSKCPKSVKINGHNYSILRRVEDMTAGQYIDYQNYLSNGDIDKWLPYILSIFLIPEGKKYGSYDIDEVVKEINEHMSVENALAISNFFFLKSERLISSTLRYLGWMMKKMEKKEKNKEVKEKIAEARSQMVSLQNTIKNGDGLRL